MIKTGCVSIFGVVTHRVFLPQILPHLKKSYAGLCQVMVKNREPFDE